MSFMLENLYLGDADDACDTNKLQKQGITHILTIEGKPLPLVNQKGFEYKFVHALDMEETDILSQLQDCIDFIHSARQASTGILVHCYAGQSRSATVILAYMMQRLDMTLHDAKSTVSKLKPDICPNDGFMEQLELFESMGNKVDTSHSLYKTYRLAILAKNVHLTRGWETIDAENLASDPTTSAETGAKYACGKCRRALFHATSVLPHNIGVGEAAFTWRSKLIKSTNPNTCQQQLFVEPIAWMQNNICEVEGKLHCPKCHAKLGSYKWIGERCPCGAWVTPAFHITKNKVDLKQPPPVQRSAPGLKETMNTLAANPGAPVHRPIVMRPPVDRPPMQRPPVQRPPVQKPNSAETTTSETTCTETTCAKTTCTETTCAETTCTETKQ